MQSEATANPLSPRDWHVLVALSNECLHGYGIMKAVERDSDGRVTAEVGSLYRVLDRLLAEGMVEQVAPPTEAPDDTRGRPRRYYGLTDRGRDALTRETLRLRDAVRLARERRLLPESSR